MGLAHSLEKRFAVLCGGLGWGGGWFVILDKYSCYSYLKF